MISFIVMHSMAKFIFSKHFHACSLLQSPHNPLKVSTTRISLPCFCGKGETSTESLIKGKGKILNETQLCRNRAKMRK